MKVFKYIVVLSTLLIFTTNINGQTLNCPQFSATGTSQSGYIGPSSGCPAICPQALNSSTYPWDGGSSAGSLVATSLTPTTSLALAFFAVNTDDYATVTVNGGGTVSLTVSGCGVAGNVIGPYNCSGYGDVFVTVNSTLPFTVVTISNTGGSSGWVISCPGSAPNAGLDYNNFSSPLCGGTLNLNTVLSGADAGGVWTETTSSGQFTPGTGVFNVNGLAPGIYTFTYTVTSCGFTDVANISIKVGSGAKAGNDNTSSLCNTTGSTINLNTLLSGADPGGTWAETSSSGQFTPGTGIFNANGLAGGNYTFTYTVLGSTPCPNDVANFTVTVNPAPVYTVTGTNPSTCSGTDGFLTISGLTPNTSYSVSYTKNGTTVGPSSLTSNASGIITISGLGSGTYTSYSISSTLGCTKTNNTIVTLIQPVAPTVNAGLDKTVCFGTNVTLTASNPNSASISWSNGITDGTPFSTTTTTTYTVTASLSGCTATDQVIVNVNPLPTINAGIDQALCNGTSTSLSGSGGTSYTWDNGITNGATFTPTIGTTTYTVSGTDANGCINTDAVNISVNAIPVVNAGVDQTVCSGSQVTLTASGSTTYSWNNGVTNGVAFTPTLGTTTYTVSGTTSGCSSTDQVNVTVNPIPTVNAGVDKSICLGNNVTLTASNPNGASIAWNNGGIDGVAFSPSTTLTYTVTASLLSCTSTDQVIVNVNPIPTINAGIDQTVCAGTSVTLNGAGAGTGGIYTWDNGITNNVSFTQATGTITYTVIGTDANGCSSTGQVNITVNPRPIVNAGLDKSICLGDNVTLSASNPNGATISWNNGITDGVPFSTSTTMTFTVTANLLSCIATDQVIVTVNAHPTINAGLDQTLCAGTPVTLNASGAGTAGTYTWNNGVPNNVPFTQTTGTTNYTVTGTDANGCTNTDAVSVTVNAIPVVNAGADQSVCIGSQVTLTATGSTTYSWDNSVTNGVVFTPALGTITYTVSGTTSGCTSTDQVTVTVNPLPTVKATSNTVLCEQQSIILVGSGASNYSWNNGVTNGVAFIPSGTTTYTVTGTDANGCINTDNVLITIIPTPTANFSSDNVLDCSPLAFNLTNNSVGNLTNCTWTLSNGQTFNGCGPVTDTLLTVGCYDVTLVVTTPEGCTNTMTKSNYICVAPDPIAKFYTDPNELSTLVWEANMNNVSIGATTYEWNFGDNTGNSTETSPSHEFPNDIGKTYTITLIATSDVGCVDTTKGNITLVEDLIYYVPNTFTPDANKFNETFLPVFTSGYDPQNYTLLIFDRWGEILFESHNAKVGWDGTFNGKVSPDGTYIWKISFKLKNNDERQDHFGNINLLR